MTLPLTADSRARSPGLHGVLLKMLRAEISSFSLTSLPTHAVGPSILFPKISYFEDDLSCTGKAATLRVLSFSAPSFEQFCQPELHLENIEMTEKKVVLKWGAAKLHSTEKSINLEVRINELGLCTQRQTR